MDGKVEVDTDFLCDILEHLRDCSVAVNNRDWSELKKLSEKGRDIRSELRWLVND